MPAHPEPGSSGWQEYYVGHAQDRFKILTLHTSVRTTAVASHHAMLVQETTPIERGVVNHKLYVRGFSTVRDEAVKGGNERYQLIPCAMPEVPRADLRVHGRPDRPPLSRSGPPSLLPRSSADRTTRLKLLALRSPAW